MSDSMNRRQVNLTLGAASLAGLGSLLFGSTAHAAQNFPVGTLYGKDHVVSRQAATFAAAVAEKTGGEIKVVPRTGSPFGDVYQIGKQVANGQRKMDVVSMSTDVDPRLSIGYMGGLVSNWDEVIQLYGPNGKFIDVLNWIGEDVGYKYLYTAPSGFGGIGFRGDAPITLPSPVKYKTRVAPYKGMIARFEGLGLNAIPMPYSETYTALQTGAIDAKGATPPEEAVDAFADVLKHYLYSRDYFEGIIGMAVNLDWFNSQPANIQEALVSAGQEAWASGWENVEANEQVFLDTLREKGVDVIVLDDATYENIKKIAQETEWPVLEETVGKELMDRIRAIAL